MKAHVKSEYLEKFFISMCYRLWVHNLKVWQVVLIYENLHKNVAGILVPGLMLKT
jgi:hypothetical protein